MCLSTKEGNNSNQSAHPWQSEITEMKLMMRIGWCVNQNATKINNVIKSIKASERLSLSRWHIHGGCCTSHSFIVTSPHIGIDGIISNLYEVHEGGYFFCTWTQNFWSYLNGGNEVMRLVDGVFLFKQQNQGGNN